MFCLKPRPLGWGSALWQRRPAADRALLPARVFLQVSESLCSLNFADRVKKVELGSAKKQSEGAEMASLRKRIKELEVRT